VTGGGPRFREHACKPGLEGVISKRADGAYAPDDRGIWVKSKCLTRQICLRMASGSPQRYLVKMAKKDRVGRIFLDYLRNDRMSTAVAPLSPRARAHAPVSMPIVWSQVRKGLDPQRFTLRSAPKLLVKSAAWADYAEGERSLLAVLKRMVKV